MGEEKKGRKELTRVLKKLMMELFSVSAAWRSSSVVSSTAGSWGREQFNGPTSCCFPSLTSMS